MTNEEIRNIETKLLEELKSLLPETVEVTIKPYMRYSYMCKVCFSILSGDVLFADVYYFSLRNSEYWHKFVRAMVSIVTDHLIMKENNYEAM